MMWSKHSRRINLIREPAVVVGKPGSTPYLAPQNDQLMSEHRKNDKFVNLPVLSELQAFMGDLKVQRADGLIAVRDDGTSDRPDKA
jgi:hypothetical protein